MPKHILIVDDEADIRELLGQFLTQRGYRTTPVSSANEALKVAETDKPDLIISDLQLEDSDGLALIDELRIKAAGVPAILLTGVFFDPNVAKNVLGKKVSCYISKTAPLTRVLEEVRKLLPP